MAYIRTNEDYYVSLGYDSKEAKILAKMDDLGAGDIDYGYCNPMKTKSSADAEQALRAKAVAGLTK